jgi:cobalamin biosynthesis protein CbiG
VGASRGVRFAELDATLRTALATAGFAPHEVTALASISGKEDEPGIRQLAEGLGVPLLCYPPETLSRVNTPHPSSTVAAATGSASVAEAAALLGTAPDGELVIPKTRSEARPAMCTIAVARHRVGAQAS